MSRLSWLSEELERRGLSRRDFLEYCGAVAAACSLPVSLAPRMAEAVEAAAKPTLVWLEFQDCAGDTEALLRSSRPSVAQVILDAVSVDYHETIMAAAGHQAEAALHGVVDSGGAFLAVVEGSIPTGENGAYCTIGGRAALDIAREVCGKAAAVIAVGTCATFGGLPAAAPNPTGALSVEEAVPGIKALVNLPACPVNAENLSATLVYYLSFGRLPELDRLHRPKFAYGETIHDACERRAHFDAGHYVEAWGDAAHRAGECLYKMGCKGPATHHNCPIVRWNEGTSWPVGCGHPCIGCAEPAFWDRMTPFYSHMDGVPGFRLGTPLDKVGIGAVATVGVAFAGHGALKVIQGRGHVQDPEAPEEGSK